MIEKKFDFKKIFAVVVLMILALTIVVAPSINAALAINSKSLPVISTVDGSVVGTAIVNTFGDVETTSGDISMSGAMATAPTGFDAGYTVSMSGLTLTNTTALDEPSDLYFPISSDYVVGTAVIVDNETSVEYPNDGNGMFSITLHKAADDTYYMNGTLCLEAVPVVTPPPAVVPPTPIVINQVEVSNATLTLTQGIASAAVFTATTDSDKYVITEQWKEITTGDILTTSICDIASFDWQKEYAYCIVKPPDSLGVR